MNDRLLLQWLAGALEPPERADVQARLLEDPSLVLRIQALRAALEPPQALRWAIPPPGIAGGRSGMRLDHSTLAMNDQPQAGEGHALLIDASGNDRVVVLVDDGRGWDVLFPTGPDEEVRLGDLRTEQGRRVLDVVLPAAPIQRWAVALLPDDLQVDWTADDVWAPMRLGLISGEVAVASVQFALT